MTPNCEAPWISGAGGGQSPRRNDGQPVVLLVEDEPLVRAIIRRSLAPTALEVREADCAEDAMEAFEAGGIDVVLLDVGLGHAGGRDVDGYELLRRFKRTAGSEDVPVIMVTGRTSVGEVAAALGLGAHDHVAKPFHAAELVARVSAAWRVKQLQDELADKAVELERLCRIDGLTGIRNRRALDELLVARASAAERYLEPLAVLLVDVDHFKAINDTFGHAAGDHVLQVLAGIFEHEARAGDEVGRWGGEEFLLLLPHTGPKGALAVGERLRRAVEAHDFGVLPVTVSIGIVSRSGGHVDDLLREADLALYAAKEAGRNRVRVSASAGGVGVRGESERKDDDVR